MTDTKLIVTPKYKDQNNIFAFKKMKKSKNVKIVKNCYKREEVNCMMQLYITITPNLNPQNMTKKTEVPKYFVVISFGLLFYC